MKKTIALILTFVFICTFSIGVFAVPENAALSFAAPEGLYSPGDELTLTVSLADSPKAKSIALVFNYDVTETFDLIGGEWLLSGAILSNFDSTTTVCGTAAVAFTAPIDVNGDIFRLTLRVKETAAPGESVLTVTPVIKNDASVISCSSASFTLSISESVCLHSGKTYVEEKASTYTERGWAAYYVCPDCGKIFASDGTTELSEIPYYPLETAPDTVLSCCVDKSSYYPGDELTLTVSLADSPKAKSIALVFNYDVTETFDLIGGEWLLSGAMLSNFDSTTTACGTAAVAFTAPIDVNGDIFRLSLRIKENAAPGESVLTVTPVIKNDASAIACGEASTKALVVSVPVCTHQQKAYIEEKASTCLERGWAAYYVCPDCGKIFASDGTTELFDIPYYQLSQHTGGEATCTHSAICAVCGQMYGGLDPNNHKTTEIRGAAAPSCTVAGYSGDVYCKDCGVLITSGNTLNTIPHTPDAAVKENVITESCETDGSYDVVIRCSVCHVELSCVHKTVPALGHDWDDGTVTKAATATEDGEIKFTCKRDPTHIHTEIIEKILIYGDANGDLTVSALDIVRLKKYFAWYDIDAGSSSVILSPGADSDGDGEISALDIVRLKKYFAEYDYETKTSAVPLGPSN